MNIMKFNGLGIFFFKPIAMFNAVPILNKKTKTVIVFVSLLLYKGGIIIKAPVSETSKITIVENIVDYSFELYNNEF